MSDLLEDVALKLMSAIRTEWEREPSLLKCQTVGAIASKICKSQDEFDRVINYITTRRFIDATRREDGLAAKPNEVGLQWIDSHEERKSQQRLFREQLEQSDGNFVNSEAELLAQAKNLLKKQRRIPDIRNAAVFTWPQIIECNGGQSEESYFINTVRTMALQKQATILETAELMDEWKKAGWIEYSPNGSEIRITPTGLEQLNRWQEEDRNFRATGAHERIRSLVEDAANLTGENGVKIKRLVGRAEMIITQIFGKSSVHLTALRQIKFHGLPYDSIAGRDVGGPFRRGKQTFTNLCELMLEELGPEPNNMLLKERLIAGQPARNLIKIQNIIGGSTVSGIHDPYTTAASLTTIHKLADMGTKFDASLRLLGAPQVLKNSTEKKSLVALLKDINAERKATWEIRTYVQASNPHRRFLVLGDGSVVTCGMSLNHIDKDEVLDRQPAGSENAKHDQQFFADKWKTGIIVT